MMVDLGTLGGTSSTAYGVNDAGFVVGRADRAPNAGGGSWATLWQNDAANSAVDLDAWFDAINPTQGAYWGLTKAPGINNNGLITGSGYYNDGPGGLSDGPRAFVLDAFSLIQPIPGDFNNNGIVDTADYVVWRNNDGTQAGYNLWRAHFGQTVGSRTALSFLDHRQARRGLPLRLRPRRHRRRRDRARRDGHVRLGRRGRRGPGRAARQGRDLRRLPVVAARPRRGSAARAVARCGPTAGTGSRSSG